ncbi:MAG: heparinase II/III family protein, partial [Sphingomonadales bacterium]|nr:heparinase II/III family protein [Sphingomonadales bacterium]
RLIRAADDGLPQLLACKGLIHSGLCLPDGERRVTQGLKILENALEQQVLADGGHIERSPSTHLAAMRHLSELHATLDGAGRQDVPALPAAITRLARVLRMFRHGDGGLALFNAGIEEESWLVDLALAQPHAKGRPLVDAPDVGFRRIQAGRSVLIADMGVPANVGRWAHAGTLSFEMSTGKERLIVNCGPWRGGDSSWRQALRATAAHSTLTVDDTSAASLGDDGTLSNGPTKVDVERHDQEGASWLEASHDGYLGPFGLLHKRRLYASEDGADVRGEDTLMRIEKRAKEGRQFAIRFHLHPDVQCSMVEDRSAALLRLPSGSAWQMRASGAAIDINESVYSGDGATRRRTEQIVLTGPIQETTTTVKWALRRIPKGS